MSTAYNKGGFVVVAVLLALSARLVFAADHVISQVSGCDGYFYWNPSAFDHCGPNIIKDWVESQKFYVGDRILFYFDPDDSNVEEVNEKDYNGCTSGNHTKPESPKSMDNASPVNFTLEARTYYFISAMPSKPSCQSELALSFTVSPSPPHHSSMLWPVVGGVVGFICLAAALVLLAYFVRRRRMMKSLDDYEDDPEDYGSGPVVVNNHVVMHVKENYMHSATPDNSIPTGIPATKFQGAST